MLAVTTRNLLRHAYLCLPMLYARFLVARQLARTPGLIRYAGGVVGPREFLTLTVWENKGYMQAFASSGAHRRVMWLFARWSESFWSLRWEPTADEWGLWAGLSLAGAVPEGRPVSPLVRLGLIRPDPLPPVPPLPWSPRGAAIFGGGGPGQKPGGSRPGGRCPAPYGHRGPPEPGPAPLGGGGGLAAAIPHNYPLAGPARYASAGPSGRR